MIEILVSFVLLAILTTTFFSSFHLFSYSKQQELKDAEKWAYLTTFLKETISFAKTNKQLKMPKLGLLFCQDSIQVSRQVSRQDRQQDRQQDSPNGFLDKNSVHIFFENNQVKMNIQNEKTKQKKQIVLLDQIKEFKLYTLEENGKKEHNAYLFNPNTNEKTVQGIFFEVSTNEKIPFEVYLPMS